MRKPLRPTAKRSVRQLTGAKTPGTKTATQTTSTISHVKAAKMKSDLRSKAQSIKRLVGELDSILSVAEQFEGATTQVYEAREELKRALKLFTDTLDRQTQVIRRAIS